MAPTICLPELSMQEKTAPNSYRRCRQRSNASLNNGIIKEQEQRLGAKRLILYRTKNILPDSLSPPASPIWEPSFPRSSEHLSDHWRSIFARREGLLDIVARTMVLVRRNQMLQNRVNALRSETHDFIRSVLSNPENNGNQDRGAEGWDRGGCAGADQKFEIVSSSSESFFSEPTPPPTPDSSTEREMLQLDDNAHRETAAEYSPNLSLHPVNSSLSIVNSDSDSDDSDYSYVDSDSPINCHRVTQDPEVSSS